MWKLGMLLCAIILALIVSVLRWHFHFSWLWAAAPVLGLVLVLGILGVLAVVAILKEGIDIG